MKSGKIIKNSTVFGFRINRYTKIKFISFLIFIYNSSIDICIYYIRDSILESQCKNVCISNFYNSKIQFRIPLKPLKIDYS